MQKELGTFRTWKGTTLDDGDQIHQEFKINDFEAHVQGTQTDPVQSLNVRNKDFDVSASSCLPAGSTIYRDRISITSPSLWEILMKDYKEEEKYSEYGDPNLYVQRLEGGTTLYVMKLPRDHTRTTKWHEMNGSKKIR